MEKAYIIMAHKNPRQLFRLISRLADDASEFFIHIDKTAEFSQFQIVKELGPKVHFIERADSKWGGFGSVQASLNGLKAVRDSNKTFDRILLLSGQDYPIKSNKYINNFFKESPHSVFIDFFPIPNYNKWPGSDRGGLYRVDKYYIGLKWYEFFVSKSLNLLSTYLPFLRRKIPNGMSPYTGSQWWSVDMASLNYILDYDKNNKSYRAFHQFTFVPDELYVQMIIANCKDERIVSTVENNNKRFMIWQKPDSAHPNVLRKSDFHAISNSDHLFARKFDETEDAEILDLIDQRILADNKSLQNLSSAR
ncbi:MAG: hypothetical protein JWR18_1470 [Segetibacter sp.]|jgi:hypothetical protein|nr:hypothetical protein [Segetibacter sp.]